MVRNGEEHEINHRWQGPLDGQFRNLRWSGGVYPDQIDVSGGASDIPEEELNELIQKSIDESLKK